MFAMHPTQGVVDRVTVINGIAIDVVAGAVQPAAKIEDRENIVRWQASNAEFLIPIDAQGARATNVQAVRTVITHSELIQESRRECVIPANSNIVSEEILELAAGICRTAELNIERLMGVVAAVVSKKDLVLPVEVMVNADGHQSVIDGAARTKVEIVGQVCVLRSWDQSENRCSGGVDRGDNVIGCEGKTAGNAANGGGGRRIKNLIRQYLLSGAGVNHGLSVSGYWRTEEGGEVARAFGNSGDSADNRCALVLLVLFPREEEEGLIVAIVELRNPDGTAEGKSVVVLGVRRAGSAEGVVEPSVGVEIRVLHDLINIAVVLICATFG